MSELLKLAPSSGFLILKNAPAGTSHVAFVSKDSAANEYQLGDIVKLNGMCSYRFLSAAGLIRGILVISPAAHTLATPILVKIGACQGPYTISHNLQQLGILMYESPDSSVLMIPSTVASPLLVEVDT